MHYIRTIWVSAGTKYASLSPTSKGIVNVVIAFFTGYLVGKIS
jgi:hypothetical protein